MRSTNYQLIAGILMAVTVTICNLTFTIAARADILTITDGVSTFQYDSDSPNGGNADLATTADILYQETWFFLYEDVSGTQLVELTNGTAVSVGNMGTLTFAGIGSGPTNAGFDIVLSYEVNDDAGTPTLNYSAAVTNQSLAAQNVSLFNYFDHDVNGAGGDVATMNTITLGSLTFGDDASGIESFRNFTAVTHYQFATFGSDLDGQIRNGTITSLDDSGSPFGPADLTVALQWDLSLASGQTTTIFGTVAAVPEPGSCSLLLVATIISLTRRRRRQCSYGITCRFSFRLGFRLLATRLWI